MTPGSLGHGDGIVDPSHGDHAHRATGPCTSSTDCGQHVLDAVAVDGVGVAAAHLHEFEPAAPGQQR